MKRKITFILLSLTLLLALAACGQSKDSGDGGNAVNDSGQANENNGQVQQPPADKEPAAQPEYKDPVTLKILTPAGTNQQRFMDRYGHLIEKKYPNFTFEAIETNKQALDSVVAEQTKVDLIMASFNQMRGQIKPLEFMADMSDLVKAHNFDLNRIEIAYLDMIRNLDDGNLSALPIFDQRVVMFYNNDLFDKFGVNPPTDGMTWEEVYEVARSMTREEGGVQYRGFIAAPTLFVTVNPLSLEYVDPATNKAIINNDSWQRFINTFLPLYSMTGYDPTRELIAPAGITNAFFQEQTVAMHAAFNGDNPKPDHNMNWDAVTLPEVKDLRGVGSQPYPVYVAVSSVSEHRNESFAALAQLLSNEAQTWLTSEMAFPTVLKDETVRAAFAKNLPTWEGKNIKAIGVQTPAAPPKNVQFVTAYAQQEVDRAMTDVIVGDKDINTALRDAEEAANKAIAEYLAR